MGGAMLGVGAAVATAGVALGVFAVKSFNAYTEANAGLVKLKENLLTVKGNTEEHIGVLTRQANALQQIGVVEADNIVAGQSQLATFGLQAKTIETVTPKVQDMITQLKGYNSTAEDQVAINNLVGKVLTGNVGALSRYGVTLDDAQKKVMQNGTESQKAAMLVKVLGQNYGKVNEALGKTPQGQITKLKNNLGDLQESFGEMVANALTPLIGKFNDWVGTMGGAEGMMNSLKTTFEKIVNNPLFKAWIAGLVWEFKLLVGAVKAIWNALVLFWNAIAPTLIPALQSLWAQINNQLLPALKKLWVQVEPVLMPVLKALAVIVGVVIYAAIMIFIGVVKLSVNFISQMANAFSNVINWIKNAIAWFRNIPTAISQSLANVYEGIKRPFERAFNWLNGAIDSVKKQLNKLNPFAKFSPSLVDNITKGTGVIKDQYGAMFDSINQSAQVRATLQTSIGAATAIPAGGGSVTTANFTGNINLNSKEAVDAFFTRLNRNTELAQKGLATL